jgi:hypothetical protein
VDSTAALQIAENPKKLGSSRHLGVRWHYVRHQIFACGLELAYSFTEDMLADVGTKRLARKKLARFAIIFFNSLHPEWRKDFEHLRHICSLETFPEFKTHHADFDIEEEEGDLTDDEDTPVPNPPVNPSPSTPTRTATVPPSHRPLWSPPARSQLVQKSIVAGRRSIAVRTAAKIQALFRLAATKNRLNPALQDPSRSSSSVTPPAVNESEASLREFDDPTDYAVLGLLAAPKFLVVLSRVSHNTRPLRGIHVLDDRMELRRPVLEYLLNGDIEFALVRDPHHAQILLGDRSAFPQWGPLSPLLAAAFPAGSSLFA